MTPKLAQMSLDLEVADRIIAAALQEDLAYGPDLAARATVAPGQLSTAVIRAHRPGTVAGLDLVARVLTQVATGEFRVNALLRDGDRASVGQEILRIDAMTRDILTAEQTILNLLTHMSGIATGTAAWVDALAGTSTRVRDSRRTLPGLRMLQKYSVRVGGGVNHRLGLGDRIMIKGNHAVAAGGVVPALRAVRERHPDKWCEVEVSSLSQLDEVLAERPEEIKLKNLESWATQIAVQRRAKLSPETRLESAGQLTMELALAHARCGVDFLSVGALTHSVVPLHLSLDF